MNCLGRRAVEGESPVMVSLLCCSSILSRGGLEKSPLKDPETIRLQAVGALSWGDGVPFA